MEVPLAWVSHFRSKVKIVKEAPKPQLKVTHSSPWVWVDKLGQVDLPKLAPAERAKFQTAAFDAKTLVLKSGSVQIPGNEARDLKRSGSSRWAGNRVKEVEEG